MAIWSVGFLAFPIAGLAGIAVVGRVDTPVAAVVGGIVAGLVVGVGQSLASLGRVDPRRWIPATAMGMGLGLLVGAVAVDYSTSIAALALMGAVTGVPLGFAQSLALPSRARQRWAWAAAMPVLWALGWTVTAGLGIDVDKQYVIFGSGGAIVFSLLSAVLLHRLVPPQASPNE